MKANVISADWEMQSSVLLFLALVQQRNKVKWVQLSENGVLLTQKHSVRQPCRKAARRRSMPELIESFGLQESASRITVLLVLIMHL